MGTNFGLPVCAFLTLKVLLAVDLHLMNQLFFSLPFYQRKQSHGLHPEWPEGEYINSTFVFLCNLSL